MAVENREELIANIKELRELGESYKSIAEHLGISLRQAKYYGRYEEEKAWLKNRDKNTVAGYNSNNYKKAKRKKMEIDIIERMDEKIKAVEVISSKIKALESVLKEGNCQCCKLTKSREGLEELLEEYKAARDHIRAEGRKAVAEYNKQLGEMNK